MIRTLIPVSAVAFLGTAPVLAQPNDTGFVPGHLFTVRYGGGGEMCSANVKNWVDEIDPLTGERWELADRADGLCGISGLRFSPDGQRLRVLSFWNARVAEIDSAGTVTTAHDGTDGIGGPVGSNGLCWDRAGNFYVSDYYFYALLKYPADKPPKTTVKNAAYYTLTSGPDGNVYLSLSGGYIYVLDAHGRIRRFGDLTDVACIELDPLGNLFVATNLADCEGYAIHAYTGVDSASARLVTTGFTCGNFFAFTFGEDPNTLYATDADGVYALDVPTGAITTIRQSADLSVYTGAGIACYVPPRKGDMNCDRWVNAWDVEPFVAALTDPAKYDELAPHCERTLADINNDGSVNASDIEPFMALLAADRQVKSIGP